MEEKRWEIGRIYGEEREKERREEKEIEGWK